MADDDWFGRLKEAIESDGRSPKTISLAAGLGQNYVQQMVKKAQPPKLPTLNKLLDVLGPEVASKVRSGAGNENPNIIEFRTADVPLPLGLRKDVPVLGTAAASGHEKGAFQLSPEVVDYVRRPPGLLTAKDIYALYVEGPSMLPRFEPGELIFVNPNRPVRPEDYVVIQEPIDEDTIRGFVKQFVKRTGEWVVVRQFNPPGEMRFKSNEALKLHRVLTISDLLGT